MSLDVDNIGPRIGSRLQLDKAAALDGRHSDRIRSLLSERGVLVCRGLNLEDAEQLAFARSLGQVIEQGTGGIFKVTLDPEQNKMAEYLTGTVLWHFDGWGDDMPSWATVLTARKLSATGGQTEFANTYAAFDELDDGRKETLQSLRVVHSMEATLRDVYPDPTPEQRSAWEQFPKRVHPLVWSHRSGRKSLVLGSSATQVVGLPQDESRALISELLAWTTQSKFVYRHEWEVGDLVIWDNTGVLHRVEAYPANSGRMMHRTTLAGLEAIA